jgi:hypothetical protein
MFQDVHQGEPAFAAGIRPGDLLLESGVREVRPPNDLTFSVGESANFLIEKLHGEVQMVNVQLPMKHQNAWRPESPEVCYQDRRIDCGCDCDARACTAEAPVVRIDCQCKTESGCSGIRAVHEGCRMAIALCPLGNLSGRPLHSIIRSFCATVRRAWPPTRSTRFHLRERSSGSTCFSFQC